MISLDEQLKMFDDGAREYLFAIAMSLMDPKFGGEVLDVAKERMIAGFEEYGDLMFTWDNDTARRNVIEELADAVNYMVSREGTFGKDVESVGTPSE